ncbi:MAG: hypothetical protein GY759_03355 [Chloroflexi bacterium]|nr:hypothetical protein [Chloroflexota bacterium]
MTSTMPGHHPDQKQMKSPTQQWVQTISPRMAAAWRGFYFAFYYYFFRFTFRRSLPAGQGKLP